MAEDVDVLRAIERAPMRTVRLKEIEKLTGNAWRIVNRLLERGALARLTHGFYTAPPDGRDGRTWKPPLETAGLAIGVARFGARNVALTGIGAARHWAAIPRAIGVTTIAVGGRGMNPVTLDTGGLVQWIPRDLDRLDVILERTNLGQALVTTPAQTTYDLLMRPKQGGMPAEAAAAARNLVVRVTFADLDKVLRTMGRANDNVRELAEQLRGTNDRVG